VVKLVKDGKEETIWTSLLDPLSRPAHQKWQPVDVDLSAHAGRGRELVFETRGFESDEDARQAFWGDPGITVPDDRAPIAIVYLVDTLRADHTTPYGYARDTTPHLAAFARDAVVFDQAISAASWTKPAVASLMTSLLPGRHRAVQLRDSLDPGLVTLAEMVQTRGISTGPPSRNSVIYSAGTNFDQGFEFFAGPARRGQPASKVVEAGPVVDTGLEWLDERRGFPNFLYVHTMDPHVPYTPPAPFDQKYEPHPTPGPHRAGPPLRLQGAARPRPPGRAIRRRDRLRRPGVRPLRPGAQGARASTIARSSSSWPTTARSSRTTASGCTGAACSTSSSASRCS
jgi:hypothetical protein